MNTLDSIPSEILFEIFLKIGESSVGDDGTDLVSCALVNKRWKVVAMPILWRNINLSHASHLKSFIRCIGLSCDQKYLNNFDVRKGKSYVRCISFGYFTSRKLTESTLSYILEECSKIESIKLPKCRQLTKNTLKIISENCSPRLKYISLEDDPISPEFRPKDLRDFFLNCPKLEEICLYNFKYLTNEVIDSMATSCKALKKIALVNCGGLTQSFVDILNRKSSQLKSLVVTNGCLSESAELYNLVDRCDEVFISSTISASSRRHSRAFGRAIFLASGRRNSDEMSHQSFRLSRVKGGQINVDRQSMQNMDLITDFSITALNNVSFSVAI